MKAIIFGINGQDGYYLNRVLQQNNVEVIGVSRSNNNWLKGDVSNFDFVQKLIQLHLPDYIFHLAANSTTKHSALFENHETISTGTINILESVKAHSPNTKVFITGSGVQFKNNETPIKETDEFEPNSPYSLSRIYSVYAARYYRKLGINTYVGYLFHHESPLRKDNHISKLTTNFIKNHKNGDRLTLGDITVKKEWVFAEDVAEAIFALVSQNKVFEACIGSGVAYSIEDWLKECFSIKGLSYLDFIDVPNNPFKPEYSILVSEPKTINSLGWKPKTSFRELAKIMMS